MHNIFCAADQTNSLDRSSNPILGVSQIDPSQPERPFCFNVRVTASEAYEVDSVDPPISGVDSLVRSLNEGNDFSAFVQQMRGRFKDLVTPGAAKR